MTSCGTSPRVSDPRVFGKWQQKTTKGSFSFNEDSSVSPRGLDTAAAFFDRMFCCAAPSSMMANVDDDGTEYDERSFLNRQRTSNSRSTSDRTRGTTRQRSNYHRHTEDVRLDASIRERLVNIATVVTSPPTVTRVPLTRIPSCRTVTTVSLSSASYFSDNSEHTVIPSIQSSKTFDESEDEDEEINVNGNIISFEAYNLSRNDVQGEFSRVPSTVLPAVSALKAAAAAQRPERPHSHQDFALNAKIRKMQKEVLPNLPALSATEGYRC